MSAWTQYTGRGSHLERKRDNANSLAIPSEATTGSKRLQPTPHACEVSPSMPLAKCAGGFRAWGKQEKTLNERIERAREKTCR